MRSFFSKWRLANGKQIWQKVHQFISLKFGVSFVGEIDQRILCTSAIFYLVKNV